MQRQYIFSAEEVGAILQEHLGVPGKRQVIPALYTNPITVRSDAGNNMGFNTLWMGVRLVIEEPELPKEQETKLRRLVE